MNARHRALALAFTAAFAFAALPSTAQGAGRPSAQQTEPQRRPQGPVAGPAIKLPRGEGAPDERTQSQTAGAREDGGHAAAPRKWEYCAITGFTHHQKGFSISSPTQVPAAVIRYFPNTNEEIEGTSMEDALANAFAKLGDEGWELTGIRADISLSEGTGTSRHVYYFKRPKPQE